MTMSITGAKVAKLKKKAIELIGSKCIWCGSSEKIEMAHVKPTKLLFHKHRSAQWRRWNDIVKNYENHRPMCKKHHLIFDNLTRSLMEAAKGVQEEEIPF